MHRDGEPARGAEPQAGTDRAEQGGLSQSHGVGLPVRLLADENIPNAVVRQLQRKYRGTVDAVRTYDAGLTGISDAELLAWAACLDTSDVAQKGAPAAAREAR